MNDDEIPTLGDLKKNYVLLPKASLYAFLGGLLGVLGLSYAAVQSAIESEATERARVEVAEALKEFAPEMTMEKVRKLHKEADEHLLPEIRLREQEADEAISSLREAIGALPRVELGTVGLSKSGSHGLPASTSLFDHKGNKGAHTHLGSVVYRKPFTETPDVSIGINLLDARGPAPRIAVNITKSSQTGFSYALTTWHESKVWAVRANWIAVGQ